MPVAAGHEQGQNTDGRQQQGQHQALAVQAHRMNPGAHQKQDQGQGQQQVGLGHPAAEGAVEGGLAQAVLGIVAEQGPALPLPPQGAQAAVKGQGQQQKAGQQDVLGQMAQKQGHQGPQEGQAVEGQHREAVAEAEIENPVMHMGAIGPEGMAALQQALAHDPQGVDDGQAEEDEGDHGLDAGGRLLGEEHGQEPEQEAEGQAAGIAHEDAGRIGVVAQKAEQPAHEGGAQGHDRGVADLHGQQQEGPQGQGGETAGQAVETIEEVDGVDHADHGEHREGHPRPHGQVDGAGAEQVAELADIQAADDDGDQAADDLAEELVPGGEAVEIVHESGNKQHQGAGQDAAHLPVDGVEQQQGEEKGDEDGDAAETRPGPYMGLAMVGLVQLALLDGPAAQARHHDQGQKQRCHEYIKQLQPRHGRTLTLKTHGNGAKHTTTSEGNQEF